MVMVTPTIVDPLSEQATAPAVPSVPIPSLEGKQFDRTIGNYTGSEKTTTNEK
jgi:hypothetical protein